MGSLHLILPRRNWKNLPEVAVLIYEAAGKELQDQFKVELLSPQLCVDDHKVVLLDCTHVLARHSKGAALENNQILV